MKKYFVKKICAFLILSILIGTTKPVRIDSTIYGMEQAEEHWYSQKGWTYNGEKLNSLCYITSYAMVLKNLGIKATPLDVYIANGSSNYCVHARIAKYYNVDATTNTGSLSSKTTDEKITFLKTLLEKYPQGVIVGGNYGSGTHYIVAKKVVNDIIYFDDPAYATSLQGCCIDISKVYKLTWNSITTYRVVTGKDSVVVQTTTPPAIIATITPNNTHTPEPSKTCEPTALPITPCPSAIPTPTATIEPTVPAETYIPSCQPDSTVAPAEKPAETIAPVFNPLGKYKVPTKTIYLTSPPMKGEDVKWVEFALQTLGYKITVNGTFTKGDKNKVIKYQKKKGLSPDGYVGTDTRQKILKDLEILLTKVDKVSGIKIKKTPVQTNPTEENSMYTLQANWKATDKVSGYVFVYSDNKNFTNATKKNSKKNHITIQNLEKFSVYYIKIRAYKEVHGTKVFGPFSDVKKIKKLKK